MTENPFATPASTSDLGKPNMYGGGKPSNGVLMAVLIICLVIGTLGFLGSLFGGAALVAQETFLKDLQTTADPMTKQMQEIQSQQFIPNLIMVVANLIVAPLLAAGALGGLLKKPWGHWILRKALLLASGFVVLRTIISSIVQVMVMGNMKDMMQASMQQSQNTQQGAAMMENIFGISMAIAIAFGVMWSVAQITFYIWSWYYLDKPASRNHFGLLIEPEEV